MDEDDKNRIYFINMRSSMTILYNIQWGIGLNLTQLVAELILHNKLWDESLSVTLWWILFWEVYLLTNSGCLYLITSEEVPVSALLEIQRYLQGLLLLLLLHLCPPKPVVVECCKTVHHNWYWKCKDKNTRKSTKSSNYFPKQRFRIKIISHCGHGHHAPPNSI